jgi:hypothetical protein
LATVREEDGRKTEGSEILFLRPLLGFSPKDKRGSIDVRKRLGTERVVEEIQRKWHDNVESMLPERSSREEYFCHPTGRRDLDV